MKNLNLSNKPLSRSAVGLAPLLEMDESEENISADDTHHDVMEDILLDPEVSIDSGIFIYC